MLYLLSLLAPFVGLAASERRQRAAGSSSCQVVSPRAAWRTDMTAHWSGRSVARHTCVRSFRMTARRDGHHVRRVEMPQHLYEPARRNTLRRPHGLRSIETFMTWITQRMTKVGGADNPIVHGSFGFSAKGAPVLQTWAWCECSYSWCAGSDPACSKKQINLKYLDNRQYRRPRKERDLKRRKDFTARMMRISRASTKSVFLESPTRSSTT